MYDTDDTLYGQATDDGAFDDVETYDGDGTPASRYNTDGTMGAALILTAALITLWVMGAFIFKGSNQS